MCGICATLPPDPELISRALESLQPRGPDGRGVLHLDFTSLGITRLAITDVPGGEQPLRSSCGRFLVAFNGEIYNYAELRVELERSGLSFASRSDGEVIHGLYQRHGLAFADRLDGMVAIALLDLTRRRLVLAVDPIGINQAAWDRACALAYVPSRLRLLRRWLLRRRSPIRAAGRLRCRQPVEKTLAVQNDETPVLERYKMPEILGHDRLSACLSGDLCDVGMSRSFRIRSAISTSGRSSTGTWGRATQRFPTRTSLGPGTEGLSRTPRSSRVISTSSPGCNPVLSRISSGISTLPAGSTVVFIEAE